MGQGAMINEFNPDLMEEGLLDSCVAKVSLDESTSTYTRQGLKSRRKLYGKDSK